MGPCGDPLVNYPELYLTLTWLAYLMDPEGVDAAYTVDAGEQVENRSSQDLHAVLPVLHAHRIPVMS